MGQALAMPYAGLTRARECVGMEGGEGRSRGRRVSCKRHLQPAGVFRVAGVVGQGASWHALALQGPILVH